MEVVLLLFEVRGGRALISAEPSMMTASPLGSLSGMLTALQEFQPAVTSNFSKFGFSNGQSGRFDQKALENKCAKFDACIIICTIFLLSTTLDGVV